MKTTTFDIKIYFIELSTYYTTLKANELGDITEIFQTETQKLEFLKRAEGQ